MICVAASGNNSKAKVGNPANLPFVMGVASTSDKDLRSTFTTYGTGVFVAAPGEGIVTTFPGQNYAGGDWNFIQRATGGGSGGADGAG